MERRGYQYRDSPEGEDYFKKLLWATKYTVKYGSLAAAYDLILISKPTGVAATLQRYWLITGPIITIGAVYVTSQTFFARARGGDYITSAAVSGALCGAVLGSFRNCAVVGSHAAIVFGLLTATAKYIHQQGWQIQEDYNLRHMDQEVGSGYLNYFSWTTVPILEKGWVRAEDVAKEAETA